MRTKDDVKKILNRDVVICDTTLRDGEQTAGIVFANLEKYKIAQMLDDAGVPQIECGIPIMGGDEKIAIKHIANMGLDASILGWNRANIVDVDASIDCGVDSVAISMSSSDIHIEHKLRKSRDWVLERVTEAVQHATDHGLYVSCNAEDASRADLMFLIDFAKAAKDAGASRIRYCDTIGRDDPFTVEERVRTIIRLVGIDVEMHTHDDFGLANANSLAGVRAGARFVSTTVMGIGERAGNTALEEVVMACRHLFNKDAGIDTTKLRALAETVSKASGRPIYASKPFLGENCFAHEAGIHADGVMKDAKNYEPYDPDEMGLERRIVIGKHSGSATIVSELKKKGVNLEKEEAEQLLVLTRRAAVELHRSLTPEELFYLYGELTKGTDVFDDQAC